MKALKLWQAILLIFGSICLVTGGVVLYTYLTNGFGNQKVQAETISFEKDDKLFNVNLNQLEVDSDFSLTISASNAEVTEKEITLSFAKSSSGSSVETFVLDGVTYISNGIVSIPQTVILGEEFNVKIDQTTYSYNGQTFDANAGGITTIKAKSTNILDSAGAEITVAVDVPVEKIDLTAIDTTTNKKYPIDANGASKVLQNANFELVVNYYPTLSKYRYSDNAFKSFHSGEEIATSFEERVKDYCFEIVAGSDVIKHYNDGDIYFSSTGNLASGNKVKAYTFQTAKKQEDFESAGLTLKGEDYYNAMLSYLAKATEDIATAEVNFSVEQAGVGNVHIVLNTSEATPLEAQTNRLFTLVANNSKLGSASLGLAIQDEEGADLSSMISQTALRVRYKRLGEVDFVDLAAGDDTIKIRSVDSFLLGDKPNTPNPYEYNGKTYFFGNSNIKDLKNTYWEFSTNEESILVEIEVVLFRTIDKVTTIFDEEGALLGSSLRRKAYINFVPVEEGDVAWNSTNEQLNIIYKGTTQVPTQIDLSKNTNVPAGNIYQKVQYYVAKVLDDKGDPAAISADDANVDLTATYTIGGASYALVKSNDLLFKKAGTYYVVFVTIRTDAYGNVIDTDPVTAGVQFAVQELSNIMTVTVAETLQSFSAKVSIEDGEKFGVFKYVEKDDVDPTKESYYYKKAADGYSYELETGTVDPDTTHYYELRSYAVMTGEDAAVTVDIQVSEIDCSMINRELTDKKLKFYAVSSDGQTEIELSWIDNGEEGNVKSVKLNMPDVTISDNAGRGKAFYIKIVYDNTVEKVTTLTTMESNGLSVDNGTEKVHNCFMLYTPTARNIYSPVIKEEIVGTDPVPFYLDGQTLDANISMNEQAQYEKCDIMLSGEAINKDAVGNPVNGKTWLNDRIEETVVTDAYERLYVREDGVDEYEVSVSAGVVSVGVFNNKLIFASGKENATITVSAGQDCYYTFVIRTESSGLKRVTTKSPTSGEELRFETFSNVYLNMDGGTSGYDDDLNFYNYVKIEVGSYDEDKGYTVLGDMNGDGDTEDAGEDQYRYFYVNDFDIKNLSMFEFIDLNNNVFDTVFDGNSYATDNLGTIVLNNKTPIKAIKIKENFARSYTLSMAVSSEDYRTSTSTPAVSFELKVNLSSVVSAVANIYDKFVYDNPTDTVALADGVYADHEYDLNKLIALTKNDGTSIPWGDSGPYQTLHYVLNDGSITPIPDATRLDGRISVGQISAGMIKFYNVAEVTDYYVRFYYYGTNENAYYTEATFKVYPNLQIVASDFPLDYLNLVELACAGKEITNFCKIAQIRGYSTPTGIDYKILNKIGTNEDGEEVNNYVVMLESGYFKFNPKKSLDLAYNVYEDKMQLGIFLNGQRIMLPSGQAQVYGIDVKLVENVEQELITKIFKDASGQDIGVVTYDNMTALNVSYPFAGDYKVNSERHGGDAKPFFVEVIKDNPSVYNYQNTGVNFLPAVNDSADGFSFGPSFYLSVTVKGGSTNAADVFDVAKLKVPLYISTVGQHYAYYTDYNDGHPDDPLTGANEYVAPTAGFDLKTLLYGEVDGDYLAPYSTRNAGSYYQIAYKYISDYTKVGGEYVEGIYYDDNVVLDNITFENGKRESEYGRIVISDSGEWYLHLANLANEEKFVKLIVNLSQGSSLLTYSYRIKILPNVESSAVYPFATGANGAEYETITDNATFELKDAFGSYAGDKANETRYKLTISTIAGEYEIDETTDYYIKEGVFADINGYKVLPANSKLFNNEGVELTTTSADIFFALENVGEKKEFVAGSGDFYVPITFTTAKYQLAELRVGGNAVESGDGALFDEFKNSGDAYTQELATGVMFVVQYLVDGDVKQYTIRANDQIIATISLSESGTLKFNIVDNTYFINLVLTKVYTNIVDGDVNYKFNINNTSGINYIEYKDGGDIIPSTDDLGVVETEISTNKMFALQTKYTTGNGTSNKDLDLTYTAKLENRKGEEVVLTEALSALGTGNEGTGAVNNPATYGVLLVKNNSGNYSLFINRADFVDQDYKLKIYFSAKTLNENGEEETFRVSELIVTIKCSVVVAPKAGVGEPTLTAGSAISVAKITSFYEVTGGTINSVKVEGMEGGKPCTYINNANIADMVENMEEKVYDFVFTTSGGKTFYVSLPYAIEANVVPLAQYNDNDVHYATEEISASYDKFFGSNSFGTVTLACSVPETFKDYIDTATISTTDPFKFKTNHVANKVKNVRINLTFTYKFGTYTYSFNSALVFDIEPYAVLKTNTPNPENVAGGELEFESVVFGNEYKKFFSSFANFTSATDSRLEIVTAKDGNLLFGIDDDTNNQVDTIGEDLIITLKQISGIQVFAYVGEVSDEEFAKGNYYYAIDSNGNKLSLEEGKSIDGDGNKVDSGELVRFGLENTKYTDVAYYLGFNPRQLEETLTGDQNLVFMPYGSYADGFAEFNIEYNKVKTTYKVYAFEEIIEKEIVNSVNYVDGVEEIFLEQLAEGNILAEDTVACLEMSASVPSGTYYIKLNNPGDSVNPKHWIGFKYDATKGTKIYVHLGQVGLIDDGDDLNGRERDRAGYVEGVFASKTSINDLRENSTVVLTLTSFLNLKYVTMIGGEKTTISIDRDYDYTSILEAVISRNGVENSDTIPTPLYKGLDGKYYTIEADGTKKEQAINEALLEQALYGNYEVFDELVTVGGEDPEPVSKVIEVVEDSGSGFGQGLTGDTGTLNSGDTVYKYTNAEGDNVYVDTDDTTDVYDTAQKIINPGHGVYPVAYGKTVTVGTPITISGLDNISNPYFDQGGYRYYVRNSSVKFNDIEAYKLASVPGVDTSISYPTTAGSTLKKITVVANKIDGLTIGGKYTDPATGIAYREIGITSALYNIPTYKEYFVAYNDGHEFQVGFTNTLPYSSSYTYYIAEDGNVELMTGVNQTMYKVSFGANTVYFMKHGAYNNGYSSYKNVYTIVANASATTVALNAATYQNLIFESNVKTTITNKKLNMMTSFSGNNFTLDGTKYYIENLNSITYSFSGNYNATVAVKHTPQPITATQYSHFVIDKSHTTTIENVDLSDVGGFGATKQPIKMADGTLFIASGISLTAADAAYKVFSAGPREVYKAITSRYKVTDAVSIEEGIADGSVQVVDLDADGKADFYIYDNKYFRAKDVIAKIYDGDETYIIASLQTFNINNIDGLVVNDTVKLTFNYVLDNHVGQFEFKFKINMDADVKNSMLSENYTAAAQKLISQEGEEVSIGGKTVNYIELETNREYNFNDLVGAIRPSSGETITAEDVRSSSDMSVEVLPLSSLDSELVSIMTSSDIARLRTILGDDLKDNTESVDGEKVVRLSYELVRTNDNVSGKVFNFNLLPMGADNDGDYVIVKYSYNIEVGDYIWKTSDYETYSISRYVLFKIMPDYEITMKDTDSNPVVVETTEEDVNNFDNPVLVTDFEKIGEILPTVGTETLNGIEGQKSLKTVLKGLGVAEADFATFYGGGAGDVLDDKGTPDPSDDILKPKIYLGEEQTTASKNFTISFKYGYQKTTPTKTNQTFSAITINVAGMPQVTYFLRSMENTNGDILYDTFTNKYYIRPADIPVYENVQLPIFTTTDSGFIKVVARNASVDANKNVASGVFKSTLRDNNFGNDITTYLSTGFSSGYNVGTNTLAKGNSGLYLAIKQIISLGERNFQVVLEDIYGFKINFYFSMVATANPAYAAGILEFQEGNTFDIGAQYEVVTISQYEVNATTNIFYPVGTLTKFEPTETYFYISDEASGTSYKVTTASTNEDIVPNGMDYTKDAGIVFLDNTIVNSGSWTDTSKVTKQNVTIVIESLGTPTTGRIYYKLLENTTIINETLGVNTALNLPKGCGNGGDITAMTISTTEYVLIPSSILLVSADGLSTIVQSPQEDPSASYDENTVKNYVDTIELTGISAFGYQKAGMKKSGTDTNKYFKTGCDLDIVKVKTLEYKYNGISLVSKQLAGGAGYDLASSANYYKYDSDSVSSPMIPEMGRYIVLNKDGYKIPTLPGWVYEGRDYAYVTLEIGLEANGEAYVLPIEIKISKYSANIISHKSAATNISDDTEFDVVTHINAKPELNYTYYDDTIAVTLPGNGKVSMKIEAKHNGNPSGYYVLSGGSFTPAPAGTPNSELYVYDSANYKYHKAYYTGVKSLFSNYATMDSLYFVGLSQAVGHTLSTDYDVTVTFFDYDNTKVTRDGNFGFYASYGYSIEEHIQTGNGFTLDDDKTLKETWATGEWSYVYGYGQISEGGNLNRFTLVADGTYYTDAEGTHYNYFYVPTESIERGDDDKLPNGTRYIADEKFSNKVGDERVIQIKNGISSGTDLDKWKQFTTPPASPAVYDKINIPDAGNYIGNKLLVTKYYLADCGASGETYQFAKDYRISPKYFAISTTDPINNRIEATSGEVEEVSGIEYYTFDIAGWGEKVTLSYYDKIGVSQTKKLNTVDIAPFYFELGDKGTTSAMISKSTGKLYVKSSEYKLNGEEYVSVNIFVKASGENSTFVDDNLPYSGNDNNKAMITVKIYLSNGVYADIVALEDYATSREKLLSYMRSKNSGYTTSQWNTLASSGAAVASFVTDVETNKPNLAYIREIETYNQAGPDRSLDFIHFFATIDMYNNTGNKTYYGVPLTPQDMGDLGGWGGDLATIVLALKDDAVATLTDQDNLLAKAKNLIGAKAGSPFGDLDYNADIDAANIYHLYLEGTTTKVGDAMELYYKNYSTLAAKTAAFLLEEFGFTYNPSNDVLTELASLTELVSERMTTGKGVAGFMVSQTGNPFFTNQKETTIDLVSEAFALKLLQDLGAI